MAELIASYRDTLIGRGLGEVEAWASARRIEERLADILFGEFEEERTEAMWREAIDDLLDGLE